MVRLKCRMSRRLWRRFAPGVVTQDPAILEARINLRVAAAPLTPVDKYDGADRAP